MTRLPVKQAPSLKRSPRSNQAIVGAAIVALVTLIALIGMPRTVQSSPHPGATGGTAGAVAPTGETTTVAVTVDGMSFVPNRIEVPVGNNLKIEFHNTGDQTHDLVLANGAKTGHVAAGDSATLDGGVIGATTEGWCSLPGHRAMGMALEVVATGNGTDAAPPGHGSGGHDMGDMGSGEADAASPTMAQLMRQAQASAPAPAALEPLTAQTHHEYTFSVTESTDPVVDGLTRAIWTYNGTSPGPTLHGAVGDTFTITLVNDGTMGHSIDFHASDLAPDLPMRTIEPGESLVYEFTAHRAGIWMYHCGTMPMSQHIGNGLFGAVVIDPPGLEPVDESYVLVQSELYLGANGQPASAAKAAAMTPDVMMFNGRAFQYAAHPLTAKVGDRVRLWVLDAGPNMSLSFHVVGKQFDTVWTEGAYTVKDGGPSGADGAQVLPLLAAQGGFVEFTVDEAGHYSIVNHQMSLAEKGAQGVLEVTAK